MSIHYKINHTTRFVYPIPVSVCHNILCLTPRPDPRLTITQTSLQIKPKPTIVTQRTDAFGNLVHAFSIEEPHSQLTVHAEADLTVHPPTIPAKMPSPPWEQVAAEIADQSDPAWIDALPFLFDSPLVARNQQAYEFVTRAFTPGRPIREAALALNTLVHSEFTYSPGKTHVGTTSTEALSNRFGVCQDFSHAMIAAMRSIGLSARYVSGYLRTIPPKGKPRLIGADQSHAWVSVYTGATEIGGGGWLDLDPTNSIACNTDHIPIAVGRDYNDVAPIRGAFLGGGESQLFVSVDVAPQAMPV